MDIDIYEVIITPTAYKEMKDNYDYIYEKLYSEVAAKNLMKKVDDSIQGLKISPYMYAKIEKSDELKREYRRIVIDNYVILYTIDEITKKVYVSHMYYGGMNYFD